LEGSEDESVQSERSNFDRKDNSMKTRFAILILIAIAFFTSGTPIQAQYMYAPLPRQCTDAYLEMYCFLWGQVAGVRPYTPSAQERLQFARYVTAVYPTLAPAQKEFWLRMPLVWATFCREWFNSSEEQKEMTRLSWRRQIAATAAYATQQPAVAAENSNLTEAQAINELNKRRQSISNQINFNNTMTSSTIDLMHAMSGH
jgi:hypothetical protein